MIPIFLSFITGIYIYLSIICKYVYFLSLLERGGRGRFYCGLLELSVNFSLFKYCEQSKNREPILCKKKKEYNKLKVSAYACFIKIKGNRKSEYLGCGGLFWNILRFSEHILDIPAYFQLTPWCSMPSTSFVIEAFNYLRWMRNHIFNLRL